MACRLELVFQFSHFPILHVCIFGIRVIHVKKETFCALLQVSQSLLFDKVVDEETRKAMESISVGAVVFREESSDDCLIMWRGKASITPLMPRDEVEFLCFKHDLPNPAKTPLDESGGAPEGGKQRSDAKDEEEAGGTDEVPG